MNPPDSAHAQSRRRLLIVMALLALSVGLAQVYKEPLLDMLDGEPTRLRVSPPPCDLNHQACALPLITPVASEASWTFTISPHPIPVSAPIDFSLTPPERMLAANKPVAIWVELTGQSMDMGLIRVPLIQTADGRWTGTGSIPVCVSGQMRWQVRLHMQLEQTTLQADWLFDAPVTKSAHREKKS